MQIKNGASNEILKALANRIGQGQKGDNYIDMYKHNVDLIVSNLSK